jgi:drug/metabolite transporter (DMT)-like permease
LLAVVLGLGSSVSWGLADFLGGLKARRLPLLSVMVVSQATGLCLIGLIVAIRGEGAPGGDFAVYAALAAVSGLIGLSAFYRGLAIGKMSVVAPISAVGAALPVTVGVATGDRPSAAQGLGIALALAGVALASREAAEEAERGGAVATGVGLALLAALGFGGFFLAIDKASDADVLWAILANRIAGVSLLVALALAVRPRLPGSAADLRDLALVGALDMMANTLFAAAATEGLVSVVSVLASLYPLTTIVLARFLLHERLHRPQQVGVAGTLAGVALIAAG